MGQIVTAGDMHTRYRLCPHLKGEEKCFRVQLYNEGKVDETFHEHVPSHRISLNSEIEVLRALAGLYAGWPGTFILRSHLNNRRGGPSRYPGFMRHVEYPEEGVLRRYFSSGSATAWSDTVIASSNFRNRSTAALRLLLPGRVLPAVDLSATDCWRQ